MSRLGRSLIIAATLAASTASMAASASAYTHNRGPTSVCHKYCSSWGWCGWGHNKHKCCKAWSWSGSCR